MQNPRFWFGTKDDIQVLSDSSFKLATTTTLHLLQVAAKAYELLVILSLSTIGLGIYRAELAKRGLPVGLITSGFRVGDIGYLCSDAFLLTFRSQALALVVFTVAMTILAVASGPASAILVVPTPGWWQVKDSMANTSLSLFGDNKPFVNSARWPTTLTRSTTTSGTSGTYPDTICQSGTAEIRGYCPGSALVDVTNWDWSNWNWRSKGPSSEVSLSMSISRKGTPRWLKASRLGQGEGHYTLATTVSAITVEAMDVASEYLKLRSSESTISEAMRIRNAAWPVVYQPLVQTKCAMADWGLALEALESNDTDNIPMWPSDGLNCFDDSSCTEWQNRRGESAFIDPRYWSYDPNTTTSPHFEWHKYTKDNKVMPLSAVFKLPRSMNYTHVNGTGYWNENATLTGDRQQWWLGACSFVSRWVPSVSTTDAGGSEVLKSGLTDVGGRINDTLLELASKGKLLQVTSDWAGLLSYESSLMVGLLSGTGYESDPEAFNAMQALLDTLVDPFIQTDRSGGPSMVDTTGDKDKIIASLEMILGLYLTEAISRSTLSGTQKPALIGRPGRKKELYLFSKSEGAGNGSVTIITEGNTTCGSIASERLPEDPGTWNVECVDESFTSMLDELTRPNDTSYSSWEFIIERFGYGSGSPTAHVSATTIFAMTIVSLYLFSVTAYVSSCLTTACLGSFQRKKSLPATKVKG